MLRINKVIFLIFGLAWFNASSQSIWQWTELSSLPSATSNHVLASGISGDNKFVYLFAGIDSTKLPSGISNKGFRYNVTTNVWDIIADLPIGLPRIAAAASTLKNKIYIIGGYHVYENFNEISIDKVHIFDPESNTFMSDGANIPIPIDDHVQAVWKDSLIFIVTGWSNTANVPNVQIYNPTTNLWSAGTSVPNNNNYKAFGASGAIIGDTIYYVGGATGSNFSGTNVFRKGAINPENPTEINWSLGENNPGNAGYRMGAIAFDNSLYWLGGGNNTYNFDGIAYDGSGGVHPLPRIMEYNTTLGLWNEGIETELAIMDIRGLAQIDNNSFIIAGGMHSNQEVENKVYLIELNTTNFIEKFSEENIFKIIQNPLNNKLLNIDVSVGGKMQCKIFNSTGQLLIDCRLDGENNSINLSKLSNGIYVVKLTSDFGCFRKKIILE